MFFFYQLGSISYFMKYPYVMNPAVKVLGAVSPVLPHSSSNAILSYADDEEDDRFSPGEVLKFEKSGFAWGQLFGFEDASFADKIVAIRFKIKFLDYIPAIGEGWALVVYGTEHTSWINSCVLNKWCDILLKINKVSGTSNNLHITFSFSAVQSAMKFHFAHFTITVITPYTVCSNIQRGYSETGASSHVNAGGLRSWYSCSSYCANYAQMTWFMSGPGSSNGNCRCTNGANLLHDETAMFCDQSHRNTNSVNGQWGLWGSWSDCTYIENQGCASRRTRICEVFPETFNGGTANCPGGSVEVKTCYASFVDAFSNQEERSQKPAEVITYFTELAFHYYVMDYHNTQFWTSSSRTNGREDNIFDGVTSWPVTNSYLVSNTGLNNEGTELRTVIPHGMISPINNIATGLAAKSSATMNYNVKYRMTDNSATSKPHITNIIMLESSVNNRKYFVEQLITERMPLDQSETGDFDVVPSYPSGTLILPSARPTITIRLTPTKKLISATSLSITLHVPPTIDIEETPWIRAHVGSAVVNKEQRTLTWKLPYLEALAEYMDVKFTIRIAVDENTYRSQDFTIKIPITVSFCDKRTCNASYPQHIKSHALKLLNVRGYRNAQMHYEGPKRIKYNTDARYLHVDSAYRLAPSINKYKTNLHQKEFEWYGEDARHKIFMNLRNTTEVLFGTYSHDTNEKSNITFGFVNGSYFAYNPTAMKGTCLDILEIGPVVIGESSWLMHELNYCPKGKFKLLKGLDKSSNLVYRGVLKVNIGTSDVIVVVNPSRDLGASYNCFFTTDLGGKWKAISSMVTNVDFYIKSTDYMYGRCNYGKSYCKFSINKVSMSNTNSADILATSQNEYNVARGTVEAEATLVVDDIEFSDSNPMESSIDETIGVSIHGVYKLIGGAWVRIFGWAE